MKINHYALLNQDIHNLITENGWEKLRTDTSEPDYFIPTKLEDYDKRANGGILNKLAEDIIHQSQEKNLNKIFSIGVGIASLEYSIKKNSNLGVIVSDYNDAVFRLKSFNIFDDVVQLNVLADVLPVLTDTLVIFPRIDTEFTDDQLVTVIKKCFEAKVKILYFIPAQLLTFKTILVELKILATSILTGKHRTFCGYSRTKRHFLKLFLPYYSADTILIDAKLIFIFTIRNSNSKDA